MKIRVLLFALLAAVTINARGEYNEKLSKKAAEEVWGMNLPAFDAKRQIPADISKDQSAVYIAKYDYIEGDHTEDISIAKSRTMGNANTNVTKLKVIRREMVKLLDQAGVEDFSEVELENDNEVKFDIFEIVHTNNLYGARIHKPSGEIVDIDISKALSVGEGKKGEEEVGRKLPISGLEVGDVFEYFTYEITEFEEISPGVERFTVIDKYPILSYELSGKFNPELTVEYRPYNGAPELGTAKDEKGNFVAGIKIDNLPGRKPLKWFLPARQIPYYRIHVLNNTSAMVWHPKGSRPGGFYPGVLAPTYYGDIAEQLVKAGSPDDLLKPVMKYMKEYMKNNTGEKRRAYIDRTWLATIYYAMIDDGLQADPWSVILTYTTALRKLKLNDRPIGVGFVNPRSSFATDELMGLLDVHPVAVVGDSIYQCDNITTCLPGEVMGEFQGESGAAFFSDLSDKFNKHVPEPISVPVTTPNANQSSNQIKVKIDVNADNYPVIFDRTVRNTGNQKAESGLLSNSGNLAKDLEEYLGIPEKDAYKPKDKELELYKKAFDEFMPVEAETYLGVKPSKITSCDIVSLGITPKAKAERFTMTGEIEGLVTDIGDGELMFNIGRLFGKNTKLQGSDRERDVDAVFGSPNQVTYAVELEIPEGYHVDPAAIEALNSKVANAVGSYIVSAQLSEDNKALTVNVVDRINTYVVPVDHWQEFLALLDAGAAFNETSIVLMK